MSGGPGKIQAGAFSPILGTTGEVILTDGAHVASWGAAGWETEGDVRARGGNTDLPVLRRKTGLPRTDQLPVVWQGPDRPFAACRPDGHQMGNRIRGDDRTGRDAGSRGISVGCWEAIPGSLAPGPGRAQRQTALRAAVARSAIAAARAAAIAPASATRGPRSAMARRPRSAMARRPAPISVPPATAGTGIPLDGPGTLDPAAALPSP
jgi:hypothetical protein